MRGQTKRRRAFLRRGKAVNIMQNQHPLQPERAPEEARLATTLQIVDKEKRKLEKELGIENGEDRYINVIDDSSMEAVVAQFVMRTRLQHLNHLRLSQKRPYFARLDFTPEGGGKVTHYLGRWGVTETPNYNVVVLDWRSPVANLYYSGQLGHVSYDAPDGSVEGELSLKRMFTIENGVMEAMFDTGIAGQEKFLEEALSQVTSSRLREVVTTIQSEQNLIIRYDAMKPLLVQGVAGSGKTTIALHRIAWILYRLQQTLLPSQMLIIAPNPLFLHYISRVLPDLGVEDVKQTTFPLLCRFLMGKRLPRLRQTPRLEQRLHMTKAQRDRLDDLLMRKGSLRFHDLILEFLSRFEQSAPPESDVVFFSRTLLTKEQVRDMYLRQQRHFPLYQRVLEIKKVVRNQLQKLSDQLSDAIKQMTDQRLSALMRGMPDGEERRARAIKLIQSREERLTQLKEQGKQFLADYEKTWRDMSLIAIYRAFLTELAQSDEGYSDVTEQTLPYLDKGAIMPEDLPAMLEICMRVHGVKAPDSRHVVIDEAQDSSPFEIKALRELLGHDAFTLVGDLMQGVHGDEGIRSWDDLKKGVFEDAPELKTLTTSYRSTVEIMELAFHVIARHPVSGIGLAKPVLRHGEKPALYTVKSDDERAELIARLSREWLAQGYFSVAIIEKTGAQAEKLHKRLSKLLPEAKLVSTGDEDFEGGVQVMGASVVKGLEFDCVLIADASAAAYPDDRFTARLFYVLCTRPLHRLAMVSRGQPCAHVEGAGELVSQ